jgi:lipopolysaccharide export system protein LptA
VKLKTQNSRLKTTTQNLKFYILSFSFAFCFLLFAFICYAQDTESTAKSEPIQPLIVNGDTVEYSSDTREITATGNVEVIYKGSKLTCHKLTVNSQTKEGIASGDARLDDEKGVIEGSKIIYNFENKTGTILDSDFRANPYFGRARKVHKISDTQFIALNGYATTCNFDKPHYRISSKKMNVFPQDKIQTKQDIFYLGNIPMAYIPQYNHSLKDPLMHVQFIPGKHKDWGQFLLSAWRFNLTENINGRIYLDYRSDLGVAEGFGANYTTPGFGKGDFKYYYTQERPRNFEEGEPAEFERYLIRLRHKWDIDLRTNLISEYYKIVDSKRILLGSAHNILKDYFFREYEKETQPLSYALIHHSFRYSSIDFLLQKRTNRWYTQTEKLPEIKYSMPSIQIGLSPFYFENASSYVNLNQKNAVPSSSSSDISENKFDTLNKVSLPMKVAFIQFTPFVSAQNIFSDNSEGTFHRTLQVIFSSGADMSTKFYRIINVKSNFLGMDISNLRHIITPSVGYSFSKASTMQASKASFGGGSTLGSSSAALSLSNKLQTKRNDQSVDLVDFLVTNNYIIKPKTGDKLGSNLSDFIYKIKLLPYSWLRIEGDTTYKHSGNRSDENYKRFTNVNYDIYIDLGGDLTFGFGQRYQRKGANELTHTLRWRLNPKWEFSIYQRRLRGHGAFNRGLKEQEYSVTRDLHCWSMNMAYNGTKGQGSTIWVIFRLKAFPEMEFGFDQSYHTPKSGSQRNN